MADETAPEQQPFPWVPLTAVGLLLFMGLVGGWAWSSGAERRALLSLPAEKRQELYSRELQNFESLCGVELRTDELEERCRKQAEYLSKFPECDEICRASARVHLYQPTK